MVDACCPICGKSYTIPEGRGRELVVTKFLAHKDMCELPEEDEFVKVGGRVGIVVESHQGRETFPTFEIQMPSGRSVVFHASEVKRLEDQEDGRRQFYQ